MKRAAAGFLWFVVTFAFLFVANALILGGASAHEHIQSVEIEHPVGIIFLLSLGISVFGSVAGFLPGTKKKRAPQSALDRIGVTNIRQD